ncbi:uncharacterized protein LOC144927547 isoform X2 [Branchiostoma floridae x Branchiostoma belcheri]
MSSARNDSILDRACREILQQRPLSQCDVLGAQCSCWRDVCVRLHVPRTGMIRLSRDTQRVYFLDTQWQIY